MVNLAITVANADVEPVIKRLGKFRKELAAEMIDAKSSGDPTATYVVVDRIIGTLKSHQLFLADGPRLVE